MTHLVSPREFHRLDADIDLLQEGKGQFRGVLIVASPHDLIELLACGIPAPLRVCDVDLCAQSDQSVFYNHKRVEYSSRIATKTKTLVHFFHVVSGGGKCCHNHFPPLATLTECGFSLSRNTYEELAAY